MGGLFVVVGEEEYSLPSGVGWQDLRWVLLRLEGFSTRNGRGGVGFTAPRVLPTDDAPSDSGGTVIGRTTLQVTVGVPIAWWRGKENELLGSEGTGRFVYRIASSNSSIPVRWLPSPIGWTGPEPWPTGPTGPVRFLKPCYLVHVWATWTFGLCSKHFEYNVQFLFWFYLIFNHFM